MAAQGKSIDCRDNPSEKDCSLEISGTEQEVLGAAVQHAVSACDTTPWPSLGSLIPIPPRGHLNRHTPNTTAVLSITEIVRALARHHRTHGWSTQTW